MKNTTHRPRAGTLVLVALAVVTLAGCQPPAAAPPVAAAPPTVFESMNATFTPQSNKLWELAGALYDDEGELDAAQLEDAQWQELEAAATLLLHSASTMVDAGSVRVAPAGVKIQSEGQPGALGAAEVQALIDADPDGFREEAQKTVAVSNEFIAAIGARDAAGVDAASNRLNEVCSDCHARFWYPEQAAGG